MSLFSGIMLGILVFFSGMTVYALGLWIGYMIGFREAVMRENAFLDGRHCAKNHTHVGKDELVKPHSLSNWAEKSEAKF